MLSLPPATGVYPGCTFFCYASLAGPTCVGGGSGRGVTPSAVFCGLPLTRRNAHCVRIASPSSTRGEGKSRIMIGKLKGLIDSYGEDFVILDVGGVGYQVHCSSRTLQALPAPGEAAVLSIETYVREDQIKLFGFRSDIEREWFRLLQTVQGVGAKVAERIVTELKDKAPQFANVDPAVVSLSGALDDQRAPRPVTDAISALINLGYGQPQAAAAIASASRSAGEKAETAQLIRLGLKEL